MTVGSTGALLGASSRDHIMVNIIFIGAGVTFIIISYDAVILSVLPARGCWFVSSDKRVTGVAEPSIP